MAQNVSAPPPPSDTDEVFEAMEKLLRDSQVVRSGHFIAAQHKDRTLKILGVCVVVLNILITSGLIEAAVTDQKAITISIKLLAFLAAALAGIQGFFNFQKIVECHTRSGGVYSSINRRLQIVMANYEENPGNRADLINEFKALSAEYLKANDDATACIPSDRDFEKARAAIKARE